MKLNDITEKRIYCKSCMQEIRTSPIRYLLENDVVLCDECISEIKKEMVIKETFGIKCMFLSKYDGIMKSWLMNFKEYGDIELSRCFLYVFLPWIRLYFHDYVFLPLPSSKKRVEKRGFSHLCEILKASHLEFVDALESKASGEQKEKKGSKRNDDKQIHLNGHKIELTNRKIVLFDDVMTSGATFEQSLHALRKIKTKKIKGLILMDNLEHGKIG